MNRDTSEHPGREIRDAQINVSLDDPFTADMTFTTVDGDTARLVLEQPVLAGLIAELGEVDRARAAASGFPAGDSDGDTPPAGMFRDAVSDAASPATVDGDDQHGDDQHTGDGDTAKRPVTSGRVDWNKTSPWRAQLQLTPRDMGPHHLPLPQPVLSALLTDLRALNKERGIAAGWIADDTPDSDSDSDGDKDKPLSQKLLPGRTQVMDVLNRMPDRWRLIAPLAVVAVVVLLTIILN